MKSSRWLATLGAILTISRPAILQASDMEMVEIEVRFAKTTGRQFEEIMNRPSGSPGVSPIPTPIPSAPAFLALTGVLTPEQTARMLKALKEKGVTIANSPRTVTVSGEKARVQNVREFRYPTKYSDPDAEGKAVPIEFETKPVGMVMEFEPVIGPDGHTIDLTFSTSLSHLLRFGEEPSEKASKPLPTARRPEFNTQAVTTELTVYSGGTVLLAAPPKDAETQMDLIFVTARKITPP